MVQTNLTKLRVKCLNALTHNTIAQSRSVRLDELVSVEILHKVAQNGRSTINLSTKSVILYDRVCARLNCILSKNSTTEVNNVLAAHVVIIRCPSARLSLLCEESVELLRNEFLVTKVQTLVKSTENPHSTILDSALHDRTHHSVYKGHLVSNALGNAKILHQLSPTYIDGILFLRKFTFAIPTTAISTITGLLVVLLNCVVRCFLRQVFPKANVALAESEVFESFLQRLNLQRSTRRGGQVSGVTTSNLFSSKSLVESVNIGHGASTYVKTILLCGIAVISQID